MPFESISRAAEAESPVWGRALRSVPDADPGFSPLVPEHLRFGLETVYEAYLVHYGQPRLFRAPDTDEAVLLGDYLYAHGLVRIAEAGGVTAVATMAELISRCASLRAAAEPGDGEAWLVAARALGGTADGDEAAAALRVHASRIQA